MSRPTCLSFDRRPACAWLTSAWGNGRVLLAFALILSTPVAAQNATLSSVHDVLNKRCVVCHGCYDAPCQLKLSSPDGWARGASKQKVYDSRRLEDAPLTRLGVDAKTLPAWREKGFFDVTDRSSGQSVLEKLLRAGRNAPFKLGAALPDEIDVSALRKNACPAEGEVAAYLDEHAQGGMPFAMAPLPDRDYQRLLAWASEGSPVPSDQDDLPRESRKQIAAVEAFLNGDAVRTRLVARYLFEHLFLAHLHLEGGNPRRFFRLIRSRTGPGAAPDEIASRRPFDDPGGRFYYRLVPLRGTVLHKEHMVYEIGSDRLERYRQLFLGNDWTLNTLPPYSTTAGGNPLSTFRAIPARSRYQFLLDNALYFVRSFIRGPVCYGQVAVNVIEDRFWVSFLDPDADLSVTDPGYLERATPILELPVAQSESKVSQRLKSFLQLGPVKYQEFRQSRYARKYEAQGGPDYGDIWDGDADNLDARLTIYRNFSSASVTTGFTGSVPETAWVIDFPLFERIYYNLVAGFDVFGNVEHQLTTRIYMDSLRREGERIFLSFLPADQRETLHQSWYRGPLVNLVDLWNESTLDATSPTGIAFESDAPKAEFLTRLLRIEPELWPVTDPVNRCLSAACAPPQTLAGQLQPLAENPAPYAKFMPDIAILLIETGSGDKIYSLVHDQAHSNIAFIFNEDLRREPEKDSLTIVPGQISSYPNFVFRVPEARLADFVASVRQVRTQDDYLAVIETFGIRRTHAEFWNIYDRIQASLNDQDPIEAGLLDLNRYRDPKAPDPIERLFEFTFSIE